MQTQLDIMPDTGRIAYLRPAEVTVPLKKLYFAANVMSASLRHAARGTHSLTPSQIARIASCQKRIEVEKRAIADRMAASRSGRGAVSIELYEFIMGGPYHASPLL